MENSLTEHIESQNTFPNNSIKKPKTNSNYTSIIHKISLSNQNEENSDELDELMIEIIEKKSKIFLEGIENPIDHIIEKYTMKKPDEFSDITSLTIKVKRNFGILNEFGLRLINLQELNLSMSTIHSVSDIGSSFSNLLMLNLSNCSLHELTGKILLKDLQELFALKN